MKLLMAIVTICFFNIGFAQELSLSGPEQAPKNLMIELVIHADGTEELVHVEENPASRTRLEFEGHSAQIFEQFIINSFTDTNRVFCDGEFELGNEEDGIASIKVSTISICIGEDGWVVAHSFNTKLDTYGAHGRVIALTKLIKKKDIGSIINDSVSQKDKNLSVKKSNAAKVNQN